MAKKGNILVLTTWGYKEGLIQSATLPYLKMIARIKPGARIFLVTQEKERWFKTADGQKEIAALQQQTGITLVPFAYKKFGLLKLMAAFAEFVKLWWLIISKRVAFIHAFCTPAGSQGYILSLLTGRKLIIDSYEPHAEAMVENGAWSSSGFAFRMLWWLEKKQSARASYCIAVASGMDHYAKEKYKVELKNWGIRPTCTDLDVFKFKEQDRERIRKELGWEEKIVCVYVGKFGGIYLDREVFEFFKVAVDYWGDRFRVLLVSDIAVADIQQWCEKVAIDPAIIHQVSVPHTEVPGLLSAGDFGITPVKPVPTKRYCSPIKDGEYWSIGLPVVIPAGISDDADIINENNAGYVLQQLSADEYLRAIKKIELLMNEPKDALRLRIRALAERYRDFSTAEQQYMNIYSDKRQLN